MVAIAANNLYKWKAFHARPVKDTPYSKHFLSKHHMSVISKVSTFQN